MRADVTSGDGSGGAASRLRDGEPGARFASIGLMVSGVTLFSVLDACAKHLGHSVPILEIAWFRYVFHFLIAAIVMNPWSAPTAWRVNRPFAQLVRASLLAGSTVLNFTAMHYLQLAQTVSINFLAPLLISGLSVLLLGERIGPRRLAAILVGFSGVLLVTRPGLDGFHPAMLLSLGSTTCGALYAMMTRWLAASESSGSMLLVMAAVPALLLAPVQPFVWETPATALDWTLLATTGLMGAGGHLFLILAHRRASAAILAPFGYAQIVSMVALGYLVFGDVPDLMTILGALVVVASGLYLFHRERVVAARARAAA